MSRVADYRHYLKGIFFSHVITLSSTPSQVFKFNGTGVPQERLGLCLMDLNMRPAQEVEKVKEGSARWAG